MSTSTETTKQECKDCEPSVQSLQIDSNSTNGQLPATPHAESSTSTSATPSTALAEILPPRKLIPAITIEFCDRCRWAPRATWIQTELHLTFPTPLIKSITLIPLTDPETGGRFRVWVDLGHKVELIWDRKTEGGFPELKVLKQKLRNVISPDMGLGHSDKAGANGHGAVTIPGAKGTISDPHAKSAAEGKS